jgi:NitT/TauT family transport system ATP-binding protein
VDVVFEHVSKVWGEGSGRAVQAVRDIYHTTKSGTFTCFIGPSGCGKSTLLEMAAGLSPPSSGQVYGYDSGARKKEDLSGKAIMVWQTLNLFPWRTVLENVAFGLEVRGGKAVAREEAARGWIKRMGLGGFEESYPHELSGGMRQRVALARALILDPPVLLMDEPFAALDAQTKMLMQQDLLNLYDETDKTFLFVTHSIDEALLLGDEVVVMSARPGTVLEVISVHLERPRTFEMTHSAEFGELFDKTYSLLRAEVMRAMEIQT